MKKILTLILILVISSILTNLFAFDMVKNGTPVATVVLEKDATASDKYAAENLVKYIKLISGAELSISDTPTNGNNIFIGRGENVKNVLENFDFDTLKRDGVYVYCKGNNFVLTGDEGAGVIYSVYSFLEEYLGVRFILPDQDLIPKNKNISFNFIDYKYVPIFFSRCSFQGPVFNGTDDFKIKHRNNGRWDNIPAELGGTVHINAGAHAFQIYLNPKDYGKEHPEWFSFRKGQRQTGIDTQLCLSNEEMVKELTKNVLKKIGESPNDFIFNVSQFDNRSYCECDKCKALTEKYGHSGALLTVINKVADAVKEKYPNVYIHTLAYQYTQHLPKNIAPRDNVIVELCSIECDFSKPFDDPNSEKNKVFMTDLKGWQDLTKILSIWDYTADFMNFLYPFPDFHILQKNLQILAENKAKLVFEEGDYKNSNAFMLPYKAYINAKLLWNPYIDMDKETKIFLKEYYGPAWKDMYELLNYMNKVMAVSEEKLPENREDSGFFTAKDWVQGFKLLNDALKKTKGIQKYYDRIWTDYLCWSYSTLVAPKDVLDEVLSKKVMKITSNREISQAIMEWGPSHGIVHFNEPTKLEDSNLKPMDMTKKGNKPEICKNLKDEEWIDFGPEALPNAFKRDDISKIVDDPKASNGKARWINDDVSDWWTQMKFDFLKSFDNYSTAEVYVSYRIDPGNAQAQSYTMGVYGGKDYSKKYEIYNSDTMDGNYTTVLLDKIDIANLKVGTYFWVAGKDLKTSPGLYIDRLFIVLKK